MTDLSLSLSPHYSYKLFSFPSRGHSPANHHSFTCLDLHLSCLSCPLTSLSPIFSSIFLPGCLLLLASSLFDLILIQKWWLQLRPCSSLFGQMLTNVAWKTHFFLLYVLPSVHHSKSIYICSIYICYIFIQNTFSCVLYKLVISRAQKYTHLSSASLTLLPLHAMLGSFLCLCQVQG